MLARSYHCVFFFWILVTTGSGIDICGLTLSYVASEKAGFNLSRKMFWVQFLMDMVKNFLFLFRILKGPLEGGCREYVPAKLRIKTCVHVSNSFEIYVAFLHCAGGL